MRYLATISWLIILLMPACRPATKTMQTPAANHAHRLPAWDLQGHRGCRGLLPENTIPAMLHALELGVTTLEMDAVITADSQVILSHEPWFDRDISTKPGGGELTAITEKLANIYKMPYAEVQRWDVGMRPHPRFPEQKKMPATKPLLRDVVAAVKAWCAERNRPMPFFNIETKSQPAGDGLYHPRPAVFVDLLMRVVDETGIRERTIIQSFDFRTLQYLHQTRPDVMTAALIEGHDSRSFARQLERLGFIPTVYSPAYSLVTPLLVKQCKEMNIKLIPWTVNNPAEGVRLKEMGVDGLITDYPDRVR